MSTVYVSAGSDAVSDVADVTAAALQVGSSL